MIKEERRDYLFSKNQKLIKKLNELVGSESNKLLSQRKLAEILNCSNSSVARWLRGETPLSREYALKICDILNLDKIEYLGYEENNNYSKLNEENKQKVQEYINYLLYLQETVKEEPSKKLVKSSTNNR